MNFREHATKAVDYSIRVALISLVAFPVGLCAWWSIGFHQPDTPNPTGDRISQIIGIAGIIFISPGYAAAKLLALAHVPSDEPFSVLYWLAGVISVPAFWGTLIYFIVQLYRHARLAREKV
jgi:hypothetical protein